MSVSRTTLRLITVLFLLAGVLLLRKPRLRSDQCPLATDPGSPTLSQSCRDPGSPMRALAHWGGIGWDISAGQARTALLPGSRPLPDESRQKASQLNAPSGRLIEPATVARTSNYH